MYFNPARMLWALAALALCGCASTPKTETYDPLQGTNRPVESVNDSLDRHVFKPVADAYVSVTPQPVRRSISNFFSNVGYINVILNDFLQGKVHQGMSDTTRFLVNTTVGIGGLFDPATGMGMPAHDEDFGQTLGVWGSGSGAYLVFPLAGPSSARDVPGLVMSSVTSILFYVANFTIAAPLTVLGGIDKRAQADEAITFRNEAALDPYIFTREAYLQHRRYLIFDGNPPLDDDLFEESDEADVMLDDQNLEHLELLSALHSKIALQDRGNFELRSMGPRPVN